ncbi:MAG: type II secretion system protein [Planctomycetales bacterium]
MAESEWVMRVLPSRQSAGNRQGFTLLELLIVVGVIGLLMASLGAVVSNMLQGARETQTLATLQKVDGLLLERQRALERYFSRPTSGFKAIVNRRVRAFHVVIPGLDSGFVDKMTRKQFQKFYMPQSFADFVWAGQFLSDVEPGIDNGQPGNPSLPNGIPDRIEGLSLPAKFDLTKHDPVTESAEMLYFALTELDVFGVPPIGGDEFSTDEVADTDGDGLKEFVDGWGQPLRFYRWPTRLIKPYGVFGPDGQPGTAGTNDNILVENNGLPPVVNHLDVRSDNSIWDFAEVGWPGTDDVIVTTPIRDQASVYFSGLPKPPIVAGQYDLLNADPEDPYGRLLIEFARFAPTGQDLLTWFPETLYHDLNTYHRPLVISAGADGQLALYEPYIVNEDLNGNGSVTMPEDGSNRGFALPPGFPIVIPAEDVNSNGMLDQLRENIDGIPGDELILGYLAMPRSLVDSDGDGVFDVNGEEYGLDDLSTRRIRAGGR